MSISPHEPSLPAIDRSISSARRRLNESIYERALHLRVADDAPIEFICECGRPDCDARIDLLLPQFDRLSAPGRLVAHA